MHVESLRSNVVLKQRTRICPQYLSTVVFGMDASLQWKPFTCTIRKGKTKNIFDLRFKTTWRSVPIISTLRRIPCLRSVGDKRITSLSGEVGEGGKRDCVLKEHHCGALDRDKLCKNLNTKMVLSPSHSLFADDLPNS